MKIVASLMTLVSIILVSLLIAERGDLKTRDLECSQLRNQIDLHVLTTNVLRDQVNDYQQQLIESKMQKTYEDGLMDGIKNSQNISYMQGYHAASRDMNTFSNEMEVVEQ